MKSLTETGTPIQNLRDLGLGPGLKAEKPGLEAGIRNGAKNPGLGPGPIISKSGIRDGDWDSKF